MICIVSEQGGIFGDSFAYDIIYMFFSIMIGGLTPTHLASFQGQFKAAEKRPGIDHSRMHKNSVYFTDILQYTSRPTTVKTQCFGHVTQLHAAI